MLINLNELRLRMSPCACIYSTCEHASAFLKTKHQITFLTINYNTYTYNIINTNYIKAGKYEKERKKGDDNNNIYIGLLKLLGP